MDNPRIVKICRKTLVTNINDIDFIKSVGGKTRWDDEAGKCYEILLIHKEKVDKYIDGKKVELQVPESPDLEPLEPASGSITAQPDEPCLEIIPEPETVESEDEIETDTDPKESEVLIHFPQYELNTEYKKTKYYDNLTNAYRHYMIEVEKGVSKLNTFLRSISSETLTLKNIQKIYRLCQTLLCFNLHQAGIRFQCSKEMMTEIKRCEEYARNSMSVAVSLNPKASEGVW